MTRRTFKIPTDPEEPKPAPMWPLVVLLVLSAAALLWAGSNG